MPTEYTLTYFDARGRGEPIRVILAYAGAVWKDNRIPYFGIGKSPIPEKVKERCKYGQVPLLEFSGKKLVQSATIGRYLGQEFRLAGKDRYESALCDEYVDTLTDIVNLFVPWFTAQDEEKKAEAYKQGLQTAKDRYLNKINDILKENGGHLVGKSLTWADIYFAVQIDAFTKWGKPDDIADLTHIARLIETVFETKGIKEYLAKRPETAM